MALLKAQMEQQTRSQTQMMNMLQMMATTRSPDACQTPVLQTPREEPTPSRSPRNKKHFRRSPHHAAAAAKKNSPRLSPRHAAKTNSSPRRSPRHAAKKNSPRRSPRHAAKKNSPRRSPRHDAAAKKNSPRRSPRHADAAKNKRRSLSQSPSSPKRKKL